jgi:hypothetical protein
MNGNQELDPAAAQAWRDYDRGMSALARQDAYMQGTPHERAAIRRQATGLRAPEQRPASRISGEFLLPQTPLDYGLMALGGPLPRAAKTAAIGMGALFEPREAQARARNVVSKAGDLIRGFGRSPESIAREHALSPQLSESMRNVANEPAYVLDPQRTFAPGIYKNPRQIAEEAAAKVAPEHPALKNLFGVTRQDLWEIGERGARKGNVEPQLNVPARKGEGSYVAQNIATPANAQRLIDTLAEAQRFPQLIHGSDAWYVMDPAYQRMVQLVGPQRAAEEYRRFNAIMTPFSSNSDVLKEINRGTAARMMADRGPEAWRQFVQHGGVPVEQRGADFPAIMQDVIPHMRQSMHVEPVERWLASGEHGFGKGTVKNPLYSLASGVPETGFQTRWAVPDAHFARATGVADVRTTAKPGMHMEGPEYRDMAPWYREQVAAPLGIEAVPAQARQWNVFGPQTGVTTPLGAPKLELLAQRIAERAQKLGIDPQKLRDDVLMGKEHALWLMGVPAAAAGMSSLAREDQYQP